MPSLGGLQMTDAVYVSPTSIRVTFSTTYDDQLYQLYAGRKLIGSTGDLSERAITAQLQPSLYPQHLCIVAVDPANRFTDYGDLLPKRPYNRVRIRFTTSASPSDMKFLDVLGADEPGGDPETLIERVPFDVDRQYEVLTPPLPGTGNWPFQVKGRDDKPSGDTDSPGNVGPALDLDEDVLAYPPDVVMAGPNSPRFTVTIESGVATAFFTPQF